MLIKKKKILIQKVKLIKVLSNNNKTKIIEVKFSTKLLKANYKLYSNQKPVCNQ